MGFKCVASHGLGQMSRNSALHPVKRFLPGKLLTKLFFPAFIFQEILAVLSSVFHQGKTVREVSPLNRMARPVMPPLLSPPPPHPLPLPPAPLPPPPPPSPWQRRVRWRTRFWWAWFRSGLKRAIRKVGPECLPASPITPSGSGNISEGRQEKETPFWPIMACQREVSLFFSSSSSSLSRRQHQRHTRRGDGVGVGAC